MISDKMQTALNDQIGAELYSSYLYLAMASYCESRNLHGFAHWLTMQSTEEREHAMKLVKHLQERGGTVRFDAVEAPPSDFRSVEDVFTRVLDHERKITGRIHEIFALARKENDYASEAMLQWFVSEQVEEEANASELLEILRTIGEKSQGLYYLDSRAGKRA
jgi:ferritin